MEINILKLIDFEEVNKLLEGFNQSTGFVTAIVDLEGNVLSKSGWRQICTEFHRVHPETSQKCTISDTVLAGKMSIGEKYHFYECLNGLVDVAVPIVVNGEHIANLFSGQFFMDEPNHALFTKQAETFGFNKQEYLKALGDVPIVTKEKVKITMDFLLNMTQLISEITYQKMEQLQLNEALKNSEERSRSTLDNILEGCQIIGFDWRYIYLNQAAENHNRRPNTELLGNRFMDSWPGIEETEVFKTIEQALEKRVSRHFENKFIFPDGSPGWFDLSIQPVPEGVFILSIDVSERKRKEELLYESEFRFDKLYANGPFGMVMTDIDFRFTKANPAFCALLGYSESELQTVTFKELTHPDDLERDLINVRKLMNKEISVYKTEKRYIRKDRQVIWGSLTVTTTYDSEGQFLYFLGIIEDITNRKNAEEKLARLNERISTATRASQLGIWDWDILNNQLSWDEQMYFLYGLKKEEFTGAYEAWVNGLHPVDQEFSRNETRLALLGEKEYDTEFRVVWPDGSIHYIKAKGEVFRNEKEEPVRMIGINLDITEQKKKDEKIREKDQEFRKLSANVPDMIYQFTRKPDGSYSVPIASDGIRNIFGCTPEEVVDDFTAIGRVIYPEDKERVIHDIEFSAVHLTHFNCEFRVQIPGKKVQWIYSNSTPERLPDGTVTWYGFNVDITHKKIAEEALRESEEKFRMLMESIPLPVTYSNESGEIVFRNERFLQVIGYTQAEAPTLKELWLKACPDESYRERVISSFNSAVKQAIKDGTDIKSEEYLVTCKDGLVRMIIVSGIIINCSVLMTLIDITDRKNAEEEIRKLNETLEQKVIERTSQLEAANKELESFSYSVSHDLRAPLRHINGYVDLLNSRFQENLPEKAKHYLATISKASKQMGALIDDLLLFSRTSRQELHEIKIDMNVLVSEVIDKMKPDTVSRKISWDVNELPEVFGDYAMLKQVWVNLVDNAIKYTKFKKSAEISIKLIEELEFFVFCIRDNGVGFDMRYANKLFGVFQRLHSQSDFDGTGIGLANVQRIILKHNGRVWAEAEPNNGATFFFSLPKIRRTNND